MKPHLRFFIAGAVALLSAACDQSVEQKDRSGYPARPEGRPFFNNSSIQEANIEAGADLARARKYTGIDFAMAMLDTLPENLSIEDYAVGLFDHWNVGKDTKGRGVLILFVEDAHSVKIEVSYELEDLYPDAYCGAYQESVRTYYAGRYFGDVVSGLIMDMVRRYQQRDEIDRENLDFSQISGNLTVKDFLSGGAGAVESRYFYDKDRKLAAILEVPAEVIRRFDAAGSPEETADLYLQSMKEEINYPFLGILTKGSQYMRMEYPKSRYFLRDFSRRYADAGNYKIHRKGDLAVARFPGTNPGPFLMRRRPDGKWVIDVVKSWAYMQSSNDLKKRYPLYHKNNQWIFAFPDHSYRSARFVVPDLLPFPINLDDRIATLEAKIKAEPDQAQAYFDLAYLLYFECYWIRAAIDIVERGLELEPDNLPARGFAINMRYRFPLVEGIPAHYEKLTELTPDDQAVWRSYIWFLESMVDDKKAANRVRKRFRDRF